MCVRAATNASAARPGPSSSSYRDDAAPRGRALRPVDAPQLPRTPKGGGEAWRAPALACVGGGQHRAA
eukprot:scaffold1529_cov404-Prasinococcus_capsulatus_cf.AAC.7